MKKLLCLFFVLWTSTFANAQDTIAFPTQQEFRKYIFSRFDELQDTLVYAITNGNIRAYEDKSGRRDSQLYYSYHAELHTLKEHISVYLNKNGFQEEPGRPSKFIEGFCMEFKKANNIPLHLGFINYTPEFAYQLDGKENELDTIFYYQSDSLASVWWFEISSVFKYLSAEDSFFIANLYRDSSLFHPKGFSPLFQLKDSDHKNKIYFYDSLYQESVISFFKKYQNQQLNISKPIENSESSYKEMYVPKYWLKDYYLWKKRQ